MQFGPRNLRDLFGGAMPWEAWSGWGEEDWRHRRRRPRFFERGDLKYVILDLLAEKPRHGYEIIRALEERFGGFYAPSPGSVYPTLQLLDDLGYVTSTRQGDKKVYAITDAGRAFLAEHRDSVDGIWGRFGAHSGQRGRWDHEMTAELQGCWREFARLARMVAQRVGAGRIDPAKLRRIRQVLVDAAREVDDILRDGDRDAPAGGAEPAGGTRMV
jgi:DNA-binding PadR family transcriptional regulator